MAGRLTLLIQYREEDSMPQMMLTEDRLSTRILDAVRRCVSPWTGRALDETGEHWEHCFNLSRYGVARGLVRRPVYSHLRGSVCETDNPPDSRRAKGMPIKPVCKPDLL